MDNLLFKATSEVLVTLIYLGPMCGQEKDIHQVLRVLCMKDSGRPHKRMTKWEICGVPICHNHWRPGHSPAAWSAGAGETTSAFLNTNTHAPCTSLGGQHPQHKNQLKTPVLCCLIRKRVGNICLHAHGLRGTQFSALTFTLSQTGKVSLTLPTVGGGPCGGISGLEFTSLTPVKLFLPLGSWHCTLEALLPPGIC